MHPDRSVQHPARAANVGVCIDTVIVLHVPIQGLYVRAARQHAHTTLILANGPVKAFLKPTPRASKYWEG